MFKHGKPYSRYNMNIISSIYMLQSDFIYVIT